MWPHEVEYGSSILTVLIPLSDLTLIIVHSPAFLVSLNKMKNTLISSGPAIRPL